MYFDEMDVSVRLTDVAEVHSCHWFNLPSAKQPSSQWKQMKMEKKNKSLDQNIRGALTDIDLYFTANRN